MHIEVIEPKLFAGVVADEIAAMLAEAVQECGAATLVLSGGSTPAGVYRALSIPPRTETVPWKSLRIYFGDERFVSHADPLSNYRMAQETLLSKLAPGASPAVFPVDTSLGSPQATAAQYQTTIQRNEGCSDRGVPAFDVVLLGMGEDGHTASLFPGAVVRGGPLVGAVEHPSERGKPGGERITLTAECLRKAKRVLFIVSGEKKAEMVQRVIEGREESSVLPARLWTTCEGKVTWFLDSGAARLLRSDTVGAGA